MSLNEYIRTKEILLITLIAFIIPSTFALTDFIGIQDSESGESLEEDLEIKDKIGSNADIVISANSQSLAAPIQDAQVGMTYLENDTEYLLETERVDHECPGFDEDGGLELGCRHFATIDPSDYPAGEYEIYGKVDYRFIEETAETERNSVLIDSEPPEIINKTPERSASTEEDLEVAAEFESRSEVVNSSIKVHNEGEKIEEEQIDNSYVSLIIQEEDLEDREEYKVNYTSYNELNHKLEGSWKFYTEEEYKGDQNPDHPEDAIKWNINESQEPEDNITIETNYEEDEDNYEVHPVTKTCYNEDNEKIDSDQQDEQQAQDITQFNLSCTLQQQEFLDQETEITFETCDIAGNCLENQTRQLVFDGQKPLINNVTTPSEEVMGEFKADIDAENRITDLKQVNYQIAGQNTSKEFREEIIIQPPENYTQGLQEQLNITVTDEAGHESSEHISNITYKAYNPEFQHNITAEPEEEYRVQSQESQNITVEIRNKDEVYLSQSEAEIKSEIANTTSKIEHIPAGETGETNFEIDTERHGGFEAEIRVNDQTRQTYIIVEPTVDQIEQIFRRYNDRTETVNEWGETLQESEIDQEDIQELEQELNQIRQTAESTSEAIRASEYHIAKDNIEQIEEELSSISQKYEQKVSEHRRERIIGSIIILVVGIIAVIVILESFFTYSDEYDISFRDIEYIALCKARTTQVRNKINKKYGDQIETAKNKIRDKTPEKLKEKYKKLKNKIKNISKPERFKEYEI